MSVHIQASFPLEGLFVANLLFPNLDRMIQSKYKDNRFAEKVIIW